MNHPLAIPLTIADLKRGDLFGLGANAAVPSCRVRRAEPHGGWGVRVEWDHGPGTRARVRIMPKNNKVEVIRNPGSASHG